MFNDIRKFSFYGVLIFFLAAVVYQAVWGTDPIIPEASASPTAHFLQSDSTIELEIARTSFERAKGLMYREELGKNRGMLFIYNDPPEGGFWMKNTLIPLDMIFLDKELNIVYIKKNAQPCVSDPCEIYRGELPYYYVIEVSGGWVVENEVTVDSSVTLENVEEL